MKYVSLIKIILEFSTVLNCSEVGGGVGAGAMLQFLKVLPSIIISLFPLFQNIFGKLQTPVNKHTTTALVYFRKNRKITSLFFKSNSRTSEKLKKYLILPIFYFGIQSIPGDD